MRSTTAFDLYHPIAPAVYFVVALVMTMASLHPITLSISFVIALCYSIWLKGGSDTLATLKWQIPLMLLVTIVNPILNRQGQTVLFTWIFDWPFYLEALVYGFFMGVMLVCVLLWFSNLNAVLSSDKIMQLTGRTFPVVGLMITMIMRLVPQFARRGQVISQTQTACAAARQQNDGKQNANSGWFARKVDGMRFYARMTSVLMGWGMEDSVDTAIAMTARGWGAVPKRTCYRRSSFKASDGLLLALLVALAVLGGYGLALATEGFSFFPTMTELAFHWGYVVFALFLIIPFLLELKGLIAWRS